MRLRSTRAVGERWSGAGPTPAQPPRAADCFLVESPLATVTDLEPVDGTIELELDSRSGRSARSPASSGASGTTRTSSRSSCGRIRSGTTTRSSTRRSSTAISSWQLYHGEGFWAPVAFPIGDWFTIRVVFAGTRADVYVADMAEPALQVRELKRPVEPGGSASRSGGPGIHVAQFAYGPEAELRPAAPPPTARSTTSSPSGTCPTPSRRRTAEPFAGRTWTRLDSRAERPRRPLTREPDPRRPQHRPRPRTIRADRARTVRMDFGFSDRAVVYLNGRPLYRGDDTYRSRDYRFLGSIGWCDSRLPAAQPRRQRARRRRLGELRRLGRAGAVPGRRRARPGLSVSPRRNGACAAPPGRSPQRCRPARGRGRPFSRRRRGRASRGAPGATGSGARLG